MDTDREPWPASQIQLYCTAAVRLYASATSGRGQFTLPFVVSEGIIVAAGCVQFRIPKCVLSRMGDEVFLLLSAPRMDHLG